MTTATPSANDFRHRLIAVGDSLPRLTLRQLAGSGSVLWTQGTTASVVFVPHQGPCPECAQYLGQLEEATAGLREWATRAMVLVDPAAPAIVESGPDRRDVVVLADAAGAARLQLGIGHRHAAVIQADRWGAVYEVETAGAGAGAHGSLPTPEDLVGLAKFIDIQCPECGVPSDEWLGASPFPLG